MLVVASCLALAGIVAAGGVRSVRLLNAGLVLWRSHWPASCRECCPFPASRDKNITHWLTQGRVEYTRWGSLFRTDVLGGHQGDGYPGDYRYDGVSPHYDGPPATVTPSARRIARPVVRDSAGDARLQLLASSHPDRAVRTTRSCAEFDRRRGRGAEHHRTRSIGAASIEGVELDPVNVELILNEFQDYTDGLFRRPVFSISAGDGRHFSPLVTESL